MGLSSIPFPLLENWLGMFYAVWSLPAIGTWLFTHRTHINFAKILPPKYVNALEFIAAAHRTWLGTFWYTWISRLHIIYIVSSLQNIYAGFCGPNNLVAGRIIWKLRPRLQISVRVLWAGAENCGNHQRVGHNTRKPGDSRASSSSRATQKDEDRPFRGTNLVVKFKFISSSSLRSGHPCLDKNLRLQIISRRHSLLLPFAVNAGMKAIPQHQCKNGGENWHLNRFLVTVGWHMLFESDCCVFPNSKSLRERWISSLASQKYPSQLHRSTKTQFWNILFDRFYPWNEIPERSLWECERRVGWNALSGKFRKHVKFLLLNSILFTMNTRIVYQLIVANKLEINYL